MPREHCLQEELAEKRCLSLALYPELAQVFYDRNPKSKALCGAAMEAFAYENPQETGGGGNGNKEDHALFGLHNKARIVVQLDKNLRKTCRELTFLDKVPLNL